MKQLLIIALCFCSLMATAQSKQKIKFSNITTIGLLSGSSQNALTIQTINGIKLDKWCIGIGVGLDDYGATSVPVFIDVRRSFGNKKWHPLVYADAGINYLLHWGNFAAKDYNNQYYYDVDNTFWGEVGVGLSKKISKKVSLNITAGFSYKHLSFLDKNIPFAITLQYPPSNIKPNPTHYDFYYKRLALRVGLQF